MNGRVDGKGKYVSFSGNIYEGDFKDNFPDGKGVQTTNNGEKYVGQFKNGERNGEGL